MDWPARYVEGPALYDVYNELIELVVAADFDEFGFDEIWLMDNGPKYTSRRYPRALADFFSFAPEDKMGFWQRERTRRAYWGLIGDLLS